MQRGMWPNMPILGIVASAISGNLAFTVEVLAVAGGGGAQQLPVQVQQHMRRV